MTEMWSVFSRYSHFGREPLWLYFILVFIFRRWSRWDTRELMKHFAVLGYDMLVSLSCASRILNTCTLGGQLLQNSPVLGTVAVFLDRGYPSMFIAWRDCMVRKRLYFNFGTSWLHWIAADTQIGWLFQIMYVNENKLSMPIGIECISESCSGLSD